jgi:phosphoribosylaminoimidazolecarboxamide formyltransferase/IMP cyclohydrolase
MKTNRIQLKYGMNPHQSQAFVSMEKGDLPFEVLNGNPGYINYLDAFNAWQLVKELKEVLQLPAAASFKHVSPAGAAVGIPLTDTLKKAYFVEEFELSPLACAYARARGADRVSSFGDFIALSDKVDVPTAKLIAKCVSDGIVAPDYEPEALEILKQKQKGRYTIIKMDPNYVPEELECRKVFGITLEQTRNNVVPNPDHLANIVTEKKHIPAEAQRDLILAMITLKYTQSNSVCFTYDGQVIGCGAGQQSRIHCTRLAGTKADLWYLRQHPKVLNLKFKADVLRPVRDNAIDQYLRDDITPEEIRDWPEIFEVVPERLTSEEKQNWLATLQGVCLGSDAFFPFRDNIDRAYKSGVRYIVEPGGSIRDDSVIEACNQYGIVLAFSKLRLFHH